MSKKRISYNLLSSLTEEEYNAMPEEVRKVYVSVAKNIPMFDSEKLRIIQKYPECFTKVETKSYGDKVKRLMNLKEKVNNISKMQKAKAKKVPRLGRGLGMGKRVTDIYFVPKDQVEFPEVEADPKLVGEIIPLTK
jgi:predicted alternative tryptophan synthase beta-subunit